MRRRPTARATSLLVATLTLTVGLVAGPAPAQAAGEAVREHGVVTAIADGDTFLVRVDGATSDQKVRIIGIQAPEIASAAGVVSTDQCGGKAATDRLRALLPVGTRVQLRSMVAGSTNHNRLYRSVYRTGSSGSFSVDVGRQMMASGLVLWFPEIAEWAHSRDYQVLAERARANRSGIWNPAYCGTGPTASVSLYVNWDALGVDSDNINGEWFLVRNNGATALSVAGWLVRDSALVWFRFPSGATIPAHGYVRVRAGKGTATRSTFYYGSTKPLFANPAAGTWIGDGGYLFDPRGNLRASYLYTCPTGCTDNAKGKVVVSRVAYSSGSAAQEYVLLKNVSSVGVHLETYYLRHRYVRHTMNVGTYLPPGGQLAVHVGKGRANATHQYMGRTSGSLSSPGKVELMSLRNVRVACKAWSGATC
jgi:endonuclease YncB( thermonuclease family)